MYGCIFFRDIHWRRFEMNYDFVEKYRQPKRTGNIICDLNPFSKLNLMVVLGLASLIVQNYIFGFCMVAFIILVAVIGTAIQVETRAMHTPLIGAFQILSNMFFLARRFPIKPNSIPITV